MRSPSATAMVRLTGGAARRWALALLRDRLTAARACHAALGPFVAFSDTVPLFGRQRLVMLGLPLVLTVGADFQREVLEDSSTWRAVSLMPGGPRGSAARRMSAGLMRLTGARHAHYRKLLAAPLRRASVDATGDAMVRLAEEEVASWPLGDSIDLWECTRRMLRALAIGLLFGGDKGAGYPIADRITELTERRWAPACIVPINLPFTPYGRMLRDCEAVERGVLNWGEGKRGRGDGRDLAAIIVNSLDVDGCPAGPATIAGHLPSLYAGATEAGHSTLFWTLVLLTQHPRIAAELLDELRDRVGTAPPAMQAIAQLPRLDAIVKESMRLFTPVPMQQRVAEQDTVLAGQHLPKGTRVVLNAFLTNRTPELYPDPDRFLPARWATIDPTPFEFPVFSGGPRICPGYWFGLNAVKVAVATILMRYRFEVDPKLRLDYAIQPTLRPRHRVSVRLHPQDGALAEQPIHGSFRNLVRID